MATSTDFGAIHCSIARSFNVMGDPWKALIIRDLHLGLCRFDQLVDDLGVSRKVLTERLNAMIDDGLIERQPYQQRPPRYDYRLSERGRDLVPVVLAIAAWGDRWLANERGVPAIPIHDGHQCAAEVVCSTCREPLEATHVTAAAGPGGTIAPGTALIASRLTPPNDA